MWVSGTVSEWAPVQGTEGAGFGLQDTAAASAH